MYETKGANLSSKAFQDYYPAASGVSPVVCCSGSCLKLNAYVGQVLGREGEYGNIALWESPWFWNRFFTPAGLWSLPSQLDVNKTVYAGCSKSWHLREEMCLIGDSGFWR